MADKHNPILTYSDTATQLVAVDMKLALFGVNEFPFLRYFGLDNPAITNSLRYWPQVEYEWWEDEYEPITTTLAASAASDATSVTVATGYGYMARKGRYLQIDDEILWVSAVSGDAWTTTRACLSTSAASHASDATVTILTQADLEGDTDTDSGYTIPSKSYNYTQIFRDVVVISDTEMVNIRKGVADEARYRLDKKLPQLMRKVNRGAFYGVRSAGSSTTPRSFGGLETFVTTNTAGLSGADLDETAINNRMQEAWEAGGDPTLIVCNGWNKRKISDIYAPYVRTERIEKTGGISIDRLQNDFGEVTVLMDRDCPKDTVYILTPQNIGFITHRPLTTSPLAVDGDRSRWQMVGEFGFVVKLDKTHAYISGTSTA